MNSEADNLRIAIYWRQKLADINRSTSGSRDLERIKVIKSKEGLREFFESLVYSIESEIKDLEHLRDRLREEHNKIVVDNQ